MNKLIGANSRILKHQHTPKTHSHGHTQVVSHLRSFLHISGAIRVSGINEGIRSNATCTGVSNSEPAQLKKHPGSEDCGDLRLSKSQRSSDGPKACRDQRLVMGLIEAHQELHLATRPGYGDPCFIRCSCSLLDPQNTLEM